MVMVQLRYPEHKIWRLIDPNWLCATIPIMMQPLGVSTWRRTSWKKYVDKRAWTIEVMFEIVGTRISRSSKIRAQRSCFSAN